MKEPIGIIEDEKGNKLADVKEFVINGYVYAKFLTADHSPNDYYETGTLEVSSGSEAFKVFNSSAPNCKMNDGKKYSFVVSGNDLGKLSPILSITCIKPQDCKSN